MTGRIMYSIVGSLCIVIGLLLAGSPDRDAPQLPVMFGLAGIGFMLAAGASALGEVARSRQIAQNQVPVPPPFPASSASREGQ
jgi:hypothetical protein